MRVRTLVIVFLAGFLLLCTGLIIESGLFSNTHRRGITLLAQETTVKNEPQGTTLAAASANAALSDLRVDNTAERTFTLGSTDPCSGFKFQLEFTNTAAAISKATLSEFMTRGTKEKEPLVVMQPVNADLAQVTPMASGNLVFVNQGVQLPLGRLNWQCSDVVKRQDGSEEISFEATVKDGCDAPVAEVIKTYTIAKGSYQIECDVNIQNLSQQAFTTSFDMFGPAGIGQEDVRGDAHAMAGFLGADGLIYTAKRDPAAIKKAGGASAFEPPKKDEQLIWAAILNKYFAVIMRPVPTAQTSALTAPNYISNMLAIAGVIHRGAVNTVALQVQAAPVTLAPKGSSASTQTYKFEIFIGPKERDLFDQNPLYQQLGYIHTIEFSACCSLGFIDTLSFAILALMKWTHHHLPFLNYGWIIIILVLLVRLVLHPITKSSTVSMAKMQKLGPKAEEIRKKYADNKQEMNRRMMELYKEQGASPFLGCLPMVLQMPIWIALYSAIYAGIELRGARFLPFWITDLSGSDAIFYFTPVTIPLIGVIASFNLLPILLAIAMFLQTKLTPTSAQAAASEQMQQQQKMMLIMMPIMMLLFLYNAPSGLNLYIMASTFGGVIEQYFIRKHIREKEAAEAETLVSATAKIAKVKKKKPKPFFRF
jgi:YidC/Oxa1 family membrane protein insertase